MGHRRRLVGEVQHQLLPCGVEARSRNGGRFFYTEELSQQVSGYGDAIVVIHMVVIAKPGDAP